MKTTHENINLNINVPKQVASKNKMMAAIGLAVVIRQLSAHCAEFSEDIKLQAMGVTIGEIFKAHRPNDKPKKIGELFSLAVAIANSSCEINAVTAEASL